MLLVQVLVADFLRGWISEAARHRKLIARLDGIARGYAFTPQQAQALGQAGAEAVIVHLGTTQPGPVPPARPAW